jgi:hypothetical protein
MQAQEKHVRACMHVTTHAANTHTHTDTLPLSLTTIRVSGVELPAASHLGVEKARHQLVHDVLQRFVRPAAWMKPTDNVIYRSITQTVARDWEESIRTVSVHGEDKAGGSHTTAT